MTAGAAAGRRGIAAGAARRRLLVALVAGVALAFLSVPIVIVVPMSFSSASTLAFPPPGFSLRWYRSFFGDQAWLQRRRQLA